MTKAKKTVATTSKKDTRRSGRSTTVPEMFMRQKFSNRAKQTQNEDSSDEDEDEGEEEHDELDSSSSDSSDSEQLPQKQQQKKKAITRRPKKGRKTATKVDLDGDSQLLEQVTEESVSPDNIFENVAAEQESIEDLVKSWVKKYQSSKMEAIRDLINFVIRSSGCLIAVTLEAVVQESGAVDSLQELQEKLVELPSNEYPIVSRVKEHKSFKRNLLNFFHELIDQCQGGAIYDGVLIESLQNWLTTMSSSIYRPFRHTATIIALRIMTSLCIVADRIRVEISNNTRQTNSEKKRGNNSNNKDKQKLLKQNATVLQRKRKDLDEYLTDFFESIFVHRSRDVESVIRTECIKELCQFIQNYQSRFVDNQYLRYFGWAFNDPHASVRCESVKSLTRLYKMEDIINKLKNFTDRFNTRLEEMAFYDVDVSVRVNTIALCSHLFQQKQAVLSEQGKMQLTRLIVSDVARVRNSAAPFIKAVVESEMIKPMIVDAQANLAASRGHARGRSRGKQQQQQQQQQQEDENVTPVNKTWITFKAFAAFMVKQVADTIQHSRQNKSKKSNLNNDDDDDDDMDEDMDDNNELTASNTLCEKRNIIITKTVEALWNQMKELQDYDAMAEYLCRDHSQQREDDANDDNLEIEECYRLNDDEETVLVNVYVVCLKTAVKQGLETHLVGVKDRRKIDPAVLEETKNELSRHLVPTLPKLITKHSDDVNKLVHLVHVPTLMNLNVYMILQQEREYETLLQNLIKIYLGATLNELLSNCAESMSHMTAATYLASINDIEFTQLQEAVVKQVRDACAGKDLATARFNANTIHSISVSVSRLNYLVNFSDATVSMDDAHGTTTNTIEYIGQLVDRSGLGYEKEADISKSSLSILSRYFQWKCHAIGSSTDAVNLIERRRDWILEKWIELVTAVDITPLEDIRALALAYLVDTYWVLNSDLFDEAGQARLKIRCPPEVQQTCSDYVKEQLEAWKERLQRVTTRATAEAAAVAEAEAAAANAANASTKEKAKEKQREKEREKEKQAREKEAEEDKELNKKFYEILIPYARGITVGVFDMKFAPTLLDLYNSQDDTVDNIVKALTSEFQDDVIGNEAAAEEVCRAYLTSLKTSFEENVGENYRSIDPTLKLARLEANTLKQQKQVIPDQTMTTTNTGELNASREIHVGPPSQVIAERIHIDGISYIFEKVSDAIERSEHDDRINALKFFRVLIVFGKQLTRARDIAKIHNHLEDCIQQYNIEVETNQKEWEHYLSYIKTIDEVLKKKGLRYDPSLRANNAETPAAHVFDDTDMNEIPENRPQDDDEEEEEEAAEETIGKRTRAVNDMDIDDQFVTKRRR